MFDRRLPALLATTAFTLFATPAVAQDTTPPPAEAPVAKDEGDVVVTARFRNETLQQVPIAITAVDGRSLAERQLNNLERIAASIPSVGFRSGASNKDRTIFIRGIGTITTSPGVEPSVSTVLDGVVLTRPGQSTLDLGEVERIEVLRGPQGTLFGKNASAGVVNIVTRNPTDEFHAFGEAGATTDEEYRIKAGVSGAIVPGKVQALIGGLYSDFDGNLRNVVTGNDANGSRRYGARGKLVVTPFDVLKLTAIGDYLNTRETVAGVYQSTQQIAYPTRAITDSAPLAAALAARGIVAAPGNRRLATDIDTSVRDENYGGSLTADLALGDYQVTSITAWRQWLNHQRQDYDGLAQLTTTFPSGADDGSVDSRQFSQELRLTSPRGGLIDYVLGAYYLRARTDERYQRSLTTLAGTTQTATTGVADYGITNHNYALFGETNVNFTEHFRAIAGYRSTWDSLDFYHVRTSSNDPTNSGAATLDRPGIRAYHNAKGSTDARGDSYRLGLQLDLGEHAQTYFTYSRGYKGPAYNVYFNMRSLNATTLLDEVPLSPETSNSYEAGIKGSTANRALSYALAVYTTDFDGYQANFTDSVGGAPVTRLINAGSVRSRGVEADVTLRPTTGFTIDLSGAYTDATVRDFNCPVGAPVSCNINGQPLPYAPKVRLFENATYRFALSDALSMELQSDVTFSSKVQYSLAQTPNTIQPAYAIWNASVALLRPGDGWQLRAYVKNIADTPYASFLTNGTFAGTVRFVPRDDRRYAGLLLRKDF
ncbi:iron complex outermembrane receptor protein [Sphingomonas sp. BE138]|uniref:TonB-dependent receptor n=1 Tax=Sphingomonas sp. BE138 TaxID=2817845 RepID=UPI00285E72E7|nr:TonB-dependent receptor [Sphingomonas sp. BE138]MDR6788521.1 iron complex outermembrane receptor protein [Sphingomonas sp. BE138]